MSVEIVEFRRPRDLNAELNRLRAKVAAMKREMPALREHVIGERSLKLASAFLELEVRIEQLADELEGVMVVDRRA